MVIALLTIPAAIAGIFSKRMKIMTLWAIIICAIITVIGLALSYVLDLPTGSITILIAGVFYVLAKIIGSIVEKIRNNFLYPI